MSSPLLLSASLIKTRASTRPARASAARSAAGRRERKTCGLVAAAMSGIRSQRAGFARRAFTNGLRPSASLVLGGRRTPIGMQNSEATRIFCNPCSAQKLLARQWNRYSRPYAIGQFPKKGILFMRRRSTSVVVLPNTNDSPIDARMK